MSVAHSDKAPAYFIPGATIFLALIAVVTTSGFADSNNLQAILRNASIVGIAAVGMSLVTISGNFISLGVQQTAMLSAVLLGLGLKNEWSAGLAILVALISILIVSVLQGYVVAVGLNPVVATLAVGTIVFGAVSFFLSGSLVVFDNQQVSWMYSSLFGVPAQVAAFVVITVLATLFVRRSVVGQNILMSGENPDTARMSGISVRSTTIWAFSILGICVVIAGMLGTAVLGRADAAMFSTLTIDVVTAVLVGGIAVQGGKGSPWMAATGAVFISLINNILILHGATFGVRQMVAGLLVLAAVILNHLARRSTT